MTKNVESLPGFWYYDPEIFAREQEAIFSRNWTFVVNVNKLEAKGRYVVTTIAGKSVVVVNRGNGQFAGYLNACRHRGARVCESESGEINQFSCPYHGWCYALDGRVTQTPGFDIEDVQLENFNLRPVKVSVWNGLVFATLESNGIDLENWLGDIVSIAEDYPALSEMEFHSVRSNESAINWKNYSDNSAEGYHLPLVHPGLNASLVRGQTRIEPYENGQFVGFNVSYQDANGESPGFWIYKYPGLLMHFSKSSFNIERVVPLGPTLSRMDRWFWFLPNVTPQQREETIQFSNEVMEQDMEICQSVQKNLESGNYTSGVLSPNREPGTIFFQSCIRSALQD